MWEWEAMALRDQLGAQTIGAPWAQSGDRKYLDCNITSLSTRSGGGFSGSLASEISPASTDTVAICWTSSAYAILPQITTLSGHNYCL